MFSIIRPTRRFTAIKWSLPPVSLNHLHNCSGLTLHQQHGRRKITQNLKNKTKKQEEEITTT